MPGAARENSRPAVLCLGETMALLAPVHATPLAEADLLRLDVAGAESTVALYLAELGHPVSWVSRVGNDPMGDRILHTLGRHNVETGFVKRDPAAPTGVYFKDPGPGGTQVHYYRRDSAASRMSPLDLANIPFARFRLVHVSGITPALSSSCRNLVDGLFQLASEAGLTISFDINYRAALWSEVEAAPVLLALAHRADIVFVGLDEAQALWGARSPDDVRNLLFADNCLIVKNGAVGATEYRPGSITFEPSESVRVIEPVGAGDAFAAGVLSGLLRNLGSSQGLRLGHVLAARALSSTRDFVAAQDDDGLSRENVSSMEI